MLPNNWLRGRCRKGFLEMFVRVEGRGGRVPLKNAAMTCVYTSAFVEEGKDLTNPVEKRDDMRALENGRVQ